MFWYSKGAGQNSVTVTLQSNTIVNPRKVGVEAHDIGPLNIKKNIFKTGNAFAVSYTYPWSISGEFLFIENTVAGINGTANLELRGSNMRRIMIGNTVMESDKITVTRPTLPGFQSSAQRKVYEVPQNANATVVQSLIDQACTQNLGSRPVVHFSSGTIRISTSLVIKGGCDVQIVGDTWVYSVLEWSGSTPGPIFEVLAPPQASFTELNLRGTGNGIHILDPDLPGGRIFTQGMYMASKQGNVIVTT